jgi:thiol-disulfide isomerase/thioredoxin
MKIVTLCCVLFLEGTFAVGVGWAGPQAAEEPARKALTELEGAYFDAEDTYFDALAEARNDPEGSRRSGAPPTPPAAEFLPRFRSLAEQSSRNEVGAQAWLWVFRLGIRADDRPATHGAVEAMLDRHAASPMLDDLAAELPEAAGVMGAPTTEQFLRRMTETAERPEARAEACFRWAETLVGEFERSNAARRAVARELLEKLERDFPGAPHSGAVAGLRFELEHLQIGMKAPDFEAVDQDGETFRLADYRRRVVVLDFWGLWCGPCAAELPHLKKLNESLADAPFTLIGVNTDPRGESTVDRLRAAGVDWRQVMDGSTDGPLTSRWNIRSFPSVFVLDREGVIRHRDLRGGALENAVRALIEAKP